MITLTKEQQEIYDLKRAKKLLLKTTDKDGKCALDKNQEKIIDDSVASKSTKKGKGK